MSARRKNPKSLLKYLVIALVLAAVAFGAYSVLQFQRSEENITGFFTCNEEKTVCEQLQHIHADIEMNVCGKEIIFPKEKGRTDRAHTHKEVNKIHWESSLKVDPQTRIPLDPTPLKIFAFLEQMQHSFPKSCPDNPNSELNVSVNGQDMPSKLDYVWSDGDMIKVEYK